MTTIVKYTETEAREIVEQNNINWEDYGQIIRQCTYCEAYVDVDDQSGEAEINGKTHFDICDDCQEKVRNNESIEKFDWDDYEEEDDDDELEDDDLEDEED